VRRQVFLTKMIEFRAKPKAAIPRATSRRRNDTTPDATPTREPTVGRKSQSVGENRECGAAWGMRTSARDSSERVSEARPNRDGELGAGGGTWAREAG